MLLTKQRKRMLPKVSLMVRAKYRKLIERLEISLSVRINLKKGIEEDRVDRYEVEVLDQELAE